ncbi:MAG: DEAD/DEAH box helicase [Holosporaceae bacterium]
MSSSVARLFSDVPNTLVPLIVFCNTPLTAFKGVGAETAKKLKRLNLLTARDVLFFLPTRYGVFEQGTFVPQRPVLFEADVLGVKRGFRYTEVQVQTQEFARSFILYFHHKQEHALRRRLAAENSWHVWGVPLFSGPKLAFFFPRLAPFDPKRLRIIESIYAETQGLSSLQIARLVREVLQRLPLVDEWHAPSMMHQKGWASFHKSLLIAHQGDASPDVMHRARTRLMCDRMLARQLLFHIEKEMLQQSRAVPLQDVRSLFLQKAHDNGFQLTDSQLKALEDIQQDMQKTVPMQRLLQGDVGSGKTLVAFGALFSALRQHKKALYLAPTTVLAQQVYQTFTEFLQDDAAPLYLLTRATPAKEVKRLLKDPKAVLIGTHALLSDKHMLQDVALVIIDEQQRFGVQQRATLLENRSTHASPLTPHLLMMTATPIPRTHSLMLKGYIQTSYLKARLFMQRTTRVASQQKTAEVIKAIKAFLARGERVFWLCAAVEESERLMALEKRFQWLDPFFKGQMGRLYGTQKKDEQQANLKAFKEGTQPLLLCTTVIETGIDIPLASLMVIEDAQHFGLSQLHQLRGRIGRAGQESLLIALYKPPLSAVAKQRLAFFRDHDDGFDIARCDANVRGEGLLLGTLQSGFLNDALFKGWQAHTDDLEGSSQEAVRVLNDNAWRHKWEALLLQLFEPSESLKHLKAG